MEKELKHKAAREHRITKRRAKVKERIEAQQKGHNPGETGQAEEARAVGKGILQVVASRKALLEVVGGTHGTVALVDTRLNEQERNRRDRDAGVREAVREKLLRGGEAARAAQSAVDAGWEPLQSLGTPQELYAAMASQQEACNAVLTVKDGMLAAMRGALSAKESEYVHLLQDQAEGVDDVLGRMSGEVNDIQQAYDKELLNIDAACGQDQKEQLAQCKAQLDVLLEERGVAEQAFTDAYAASLGVYEEQLDAAHTADQDAYHALRTRLDAQIQGMELSLAQLRARGQLARDQLDYNLITVGVRTVETAAAITAQKRRLTRLHDALHSTKIRYEDAERRSFQENQRLTLDFQRTAAAFGALQAKFARFQEIGISKFRQIQQMKEEELQEMRQQLALMDSVICQHHNGDKRALTGPAQYRVPEPPATPDTECSGDAVEKKRVSGSTELWTGLEKRLSVYLSLLQERLAVLNKLLQQQSLEASIGKLVENTSRSPAVTELELPPTLFIKSATAA